MLDEIGMWKGYVSDLRSEPKTRTRDTESKGRFRPDLVMLPAIGVDKYPKVVEVEASVNNNTISKDVLSVLHYISRTAGTRGYLVVPPKGLRLTLDKMQQLKEIVSQLQPRGQGRKRTASISVLTFDQVRRYHASFMPYVHKWPRPVGKPPRFKGFDD
jgi:hypothetical protein